MGRIDPHPLGNIIEFHELTLNPIDLDLTWHEHAGVRLGVGYSLPGPTRCPCPRLLEYFIRQDKERGGYRDPQRLSGLQVDDELKLH